MCEIIKDLFKILVNNVLNKKDKSEKLLEKAGKKFLEFKFIQMKTDNGKKKKKSVFICNDVIRVIAYIVPFEELNSYIKDNPGFVNILGKYISEKDFFWEEKFKIEFPFKLRYPDLLEKLPIKEQIELVRGKLTVNELIDINEENWVLTWRKKLILLFNFTEKFLKVLFRYKPDIFKEGNELLLLLYFGEVDCLHNYSFYFIMEYFKKNIKVNDDFLVAITRYSNLFLNPIIFEKLFKSVSNLYDRKKFLKSILKFIYFKATGLSYITIFEGLFYNPLFINITKDKEILLEFLINGIILPIKQYDNAWADLEWVKKAKKIDNQIENLIYNKSETFKKQKKNMSKKYRIVFLRYWEVDPLQIEYYDVESFLKKSYVFNLFVIKLSNQVYQYFNEEFKNDLYFKIHAGIALLNKFNKKYLKKRFKMLTSL